MDLNEGSILRDVQDGNIFAARHTLREIFKDTLDDIEHANRHNGWGTNYEKLKELHEEKGRREILGSIIWFSMRFTDNYKGNLCENEFQALLNIEQKKWDEAEKYAAEIENYGLSEIKEAENHNTSYVTGWQFGCECVGVGRLLKEMIQGKYEFYVDDDPFF